MHLNPYPIHVTSALSSLTLPHTPLDHEWLAEREGGGGLWFNEFLARFGAVARGKHIVALDANDPTRIAVYPKDYKAYKMINPNSTIKSSRTSKPSHQYSYAVKADTKHSLAAPDIVFNPETIVIMFKETKGVGHFWATALEARTQEDMDVLREDFKLKGGVIWRLEQGS